MSRADGMVQVEVEVDAVMVDIDELIGNLHKAAEGLVEVQVDLDSKWDSCYAKVTGWRMPTIEEVASMEAAKALTHRNARGTLRRLRRDYPDLFDKQGRVKEDATMVDEEEGIPF